MKLKKALKLMKQAVNNMPDGPINLGNKIPRVPAGRILLAVTEAPRGEVTYYVVF